MNYETINTYQISSECLNPRAKMKQLSMMGVLFNCSKVNSKDNLISETEYSKGASGNKDCRCLHIKELSKKHEAKAGITLPFPIIKK